MILERDATATNDGEIQSVSGRHCAAIMARQPPLASLGNHGFVTQPPQFRHEERASILQHENP
jgi:hypothetical protein